MFLMLLQLFVFVFDRYEKGAREGAVRQLQVADQGALF